MRRLNMFLSLLTTVLSIWANLEVAASKPKSPKSSYNDTKVCTGTSAGLHHSNAGRPWDRYLSYVEKYGNCTTIQESVEIVFLDGDHNYDMSFLESIRVVNGYVLIYGNFFDILSMKNLRLIRGRSLYTPNNSSQSYSLYVSTNYHLGTTDKGLKEVHFTSLHEILNGEVLFERNNLLCYANESINWLDILQGRTTPTFKVPEGQHQRQCGQCHPNCTFNSDSRYCWGPTADLCQRITSLVCASNCDHRCFGPEATECCDIRCAGGCGENKYDCWVCRELSNYGECVESCPGEKVYNIKTFKYEDNPNVRYIYGANCVKECPSHMLIENAACVSKCTEGFTAGPDRKCKRCENGICPKTCAYNYDYISNENVANYEGCTIIEGSIIIVRTTFDRSHKDSIKNMSVLNALENVHEISGYLIVQGDHDNFTSLSFLRNLRVIYGRQLRGKTSVAITGTSLEELGLNSLREISHGDVIIVNNRRLENLGLISLEKVGQGNVAIKGNPKLCYADTINWTQIVVGSGKRFSVMNNTNRTQYCEPNDFVCSGQCSADDGCWGKKDDECRFCAHYRFDRTCKSSCDFQKGLYPETENGTNECRHCDEQCLDDCSGEGSDKCISCKNVKDGEFCRDKCPPRKFVSVNGSCELCYEHCKDSCSGNESYFGPGGCSDCHLMIDLENGKNECLAQGSECPSNFYSFRTSYQIGGKKSPIVDGCRRCDSQCRTCQSSGTSLKKDHCECIKFIHDDHCVESCPPAHYSDDDRRCMKCHHECLECHGPSAAECSLCRNYRLYEEDEDPPLEDGELAPNASFFDDTDRFLNDTGLGTSKERFNCTDMCPEWMNGKETEVFGTQHQTACVYEAPILHSTSEDQRATVVVPVVIGVVAIGVIAIIVVFLKRQWAKSEENKLRIAARMNGLEIEEIITPTDAKPDTSTLRLIKETELRRGSEIGSGAFGTVFKGIWIPTGENVKIPVAIKVLTESSNASLNVELLEEARIMASVTHPCCIRILAVCMTAQMMLVTQLMPLGSLLDYLRKNKSSIGSSALLKWSAQIARGMKYLEERGIVHRDLAARNVLVQGLGQVRITDFGLAKLLNINEEQYQATGGKMPIKWLALESIQHRVFTHKSDVWSYGVTLWELFTYGDRPYEGIRAVDMAHHLEMGERLSQPSICTIDVYMIMIKCWMVDAESRPGFVDLEMEFANMSKDPGRYLVIQGDRFMRLQSVVEDSGSPTDWFRTLSMEDEEVGPEKLMTADEYLRPQDLDFHPLGSRYLQNMNSITEENNYENSSRRLTSVDSSAPSSPTAEVFKFDDLEEAAAAKKLKSSSFSSSSTAKGRDRKHSIRYTSDPCRDDEVSSNGTMSPVPGTGKDAPGCSKKVELMCFTDEADYLQPRSSANLSHCPNYLDVVDDSEIAAVKQLEHQTRIAGNPEYFLQSKDPSEREALIQNGSKEQRVKDDYSYLSTTDDDTYVNNNNNHKGAGIKNASLSTRPVYSNI